MRSQFGIDATRAVPLDVPLLFQRSTAFPDHESVYCIVMK